VTIEQFDRAVKVPDLHEADRKWFPKWIRGYTLFHKLPPFDPLTLDQDRVIGYLRHLRDIGTPAWQRREVAGNMQANWICDTLRGRKPCCLLSGGGASLPLR